MMQRVMEKTQTPREMMTVVTVTPMAEMTAGIAIVVMMVGEQNQTADPRMQVEEGLTHPCKVQCLRIILIFNKSGKPGR